MGQLDIVKEASGAAAPGEPRTLEIMDKTNILNEVRSAGAEIRAIELELNEAGLELARAVWAAQEAGISWEQVKGTILDGVAGKSSS